MDCCKASKKERDVARPIVDVGLCVLGGHRLFHIWDGSVWRLQYYPNESL
jgi:hypothetical protein